MKTIKIFIPLIIALTFMAGCGKYDEGPAISLKTKKARISRAWKVEKYVDNTGVTTTPSANDNYIVTFTKDGVVTYAMGAFSYSGTWAFTSDKTGITTTFSGWGTSSSETSTILRLTSKELWLEDNSKDKTYFIAQ